MNDVCLFDLNISRWQRRTSQRASFVGDRSAASPSSIPNVYLGVGAALLTPESIATPDAEKKLIGSTFICEAETLEDVKKAVEADIYYTSGVVSVPDSNVFCKRS